MSNKLVLYIIATAGLASSSFAQTSAGPGQQRILESVVIDGQPAQGALVLQNGAVQTFTCSSPEPYVTAGQAESGWACYEAATGTWLLHAQPPQQQGYNQAPPNQYPEAPPYVPPATVYTAPTVYSSAYYDSYPYYDYYAYPYGYYTYGYTPYARYGFGFGFPSRSRVFVNRTFVNRTFPFIPGRTVGVVTPRFRQVTTRPAVVPGRSFIGSTRPVTRGGIRSVAFRSGGGRTGGTIGRGGRR